VRPLAAVARRMAATRTEQLAHMNVRMKDLFDERDELERSAAALEAAGAAALVKP
jgi:hypothetical protein